MTVSSEKLDLVIQSLLAIMKVRSLTKRIFMKLIVVLTIALSIFTVSCASNGKVSPREPQQVETKLSNDPIASDLTSDEVNDKAIDQLINEFKENYPQSLKTLKKGKTLSCRQEIEKLMQAQNLYDPRISKEMNNFVKEIHDSSLKMNLLICSKKINKVYRKSYKNENYNYCRNAKIKSLRNRKNLEELSTKGLISADEKSFLLQMHDKSDLSVKLTCDYLMNTEKSEADEN